MSASLEGKLVVAISSRALFDFEEENSVFEQGDGQPRDRAYMALQLERLDIPSPAHCTARARAWQSTIDPPRTRRMPWRPA